MPHLRSSIMLSLCSIGFLSAVVGCGGHPETNVVKKPLPAHPPTVAPLEFTQTSPDARLTPKEGVINEAKAEVLLSTIEEIPADAPVVKAAEQAGPVKAKLGTRYFFIDADPITQRDPFCSKAKSAVPSSQTPVPQPTTRITYYSYSQNAPVIVCMRGEEFVSLAPIPADYQPPEGAGEIDEAIRVARLDQRIRDKVKDLDAHVLLTDPEWRLWWWNAEGYGHRVFYVTFAKGRSGDPQYYAVVDLTEENDLAKVRQAGEEPKQ